MVSIILHWLTFGSLSTRGCNTGNTKGKGIGVKEKGKDESEVTIYQDLCKARRKTIILIFVTRALLRGKTNCLYIREYFESLYTCEK